MSGLSSALYAGTSGLHAHGEKMSTIGNNLANVSTVGFKQSRMHFEDFMPQDISTASGVGQVGRGVSVSAVMSDFSQGAFESTGEATDVAIGGNGFFQVSARGTDENMYTKAGNFRFDEDGYLVDPNKNVVQGWKVREDPPGVAEDEDIIATDTGVEIQGAPGDIRMDDFQSPPEQTTSVDQRLNLDSRSPARSIDNTRFLIGEDEEGAQGNLRVADDDPFEVELGETDGLLVIEYAGEEEAVTVGYENNNIVHNEDRKQNYELRWNEEAEDFALWDVTGAIDNEEFDIDNNENNEVTITFADDGRKADMDRGGRIELTIEDDGNELFDGTIEFTDLDDLKSQLEGLEDDNDDQLVESVEFDEDDHELTITADDDYEIEITEIKDMVTSEDVDDDFEGGWRYQYVDTEVAPVDVALGDNQDPAELLQYFYDADLNAGGRIYIAIDGDDPEEIKFDDRDNLLEKLVSGWKPHREDDISEASYISEENAVRIEGREATQASGVIESGDLEAIGEGDDLKFIIDGEEYDLNVGSGQDDGSGLESAINNHDDLKNKVEATYDGDELTIRSSTLGAGGSVQVKYDGDDDDIIEEVSGRDATKSIEITSIEDMQKPEVIQAAENDVYAYKEEGEPFSAMFKNWDATEDEPISDARYSYQSTLKIYDENGTSYELTNYFDPVEVDDPSGNRHWEYMTTISPENDNRQGMEGSEKRGVLMTGSLTFNPGGELVGQSAFTLGEKVYDEDGVRAEFQGQDFARELENWTQSEFSENGYPVFTPNFLGVEGQNYPGDEGAQSIEMNFGLANRTALWRPGTAETPKDLSQVVAEDFDARRIPNFEDVRREGQASTQYSSSSTSLMQNQDGYSTGFLQNIEIDRNGVLTGRYDNGQVSELYALTLADFHNEQGLRSEGGNLFSETRSSGPAMTGLAGTRGLGEISSNSLEMSNVDIAEEFVSMITTQTGFQGNSRTITTTDEMLQEVINLKR